MDEGLPEHTVPLKCLVDAMAQSARYRKALEFIARPMEIYWDDDLTMLELENRIEKAREALKDQP